MQSQKIPLYRVIIEEKGCTYPKELTIENCKASDGCLRQWKERIYITFKTISGESSSVTSEMVNA